MVWTDVHVFILSNGKSEVNLFASRKHLNQVIPGGLKVCDSYVRAPHMLQKTLE